MTRYFAIILLLNGLSISANATPIYYPSGPQTNVPLATIIGGGWTQCYAATMSVPIGDAAENVLNVCKGDVLMMAGRETGSDTFLVLAAAPRADTIFDTGQTNDTHPANGSNWWFSDFWSWGFTSINDDIFNMECDLTDSPTSMCLHTMANIGGYRINNLQALNNSTGFEKVFFVDAQSEQVPEPDSLAIVVAALFGLALWRRRNAKRPG